MSRYDYASGKGRNRGNRSELTLADSASEEKSERRISVSGKFKKEREETDRFMYYRDRGERPDVRDVQQKSGQALGWALSRPEK